MITLFLFTYTIINNNTLEISELPIGYWTSDFKELLDMYEKGYKADVPVSNKRGASSSSSKSSSTKVPKWAEYTEDDGKLIKSYKNESSEANIKFTLTFDPKIMNKLLSGVDKMGLTELEKLFFFHVFVQCSEHSSKPLLNYLYYQQLLDDEMSSK